MTFDDINKELNRLKPYSYRCFSIYIKKHHNNLYKEIELFRFNNEIDNYSYSEKIKYLLKGLKEPNRCQICNKLISINRIFCSTDCRPSPFSKKEVREKAKLSILEKYGVDNYFKTEECKIKNSTKEARTKSVNNHRKTCKEKYGVDWHSKTEKHKGIVSKSLHTDSSNEQRKIVMQEKFGHDNYMLTTEFKIVREETRQENKEKEYETRRKNNTFNTSKPEQIIKEMLLIKFNSVIYQYKDKAVYPFVCDFYIPSLKLFIEYQGHWTHGGKPYEATIDDLDKLKKWKEKNTDFYRIAEVVWTIKDVKKRQLARTNNLNWIEFFTLKEFEDWYNKL